MTVAPVRTWPSLEADIELLGDDRPLDRPARVAITSYEFNGIVRNGGIGTACTSLAKALAAEGHEVDLFFTGWADDPSEAGFDTWRAHYRELGIQLDQLDTAPYSHCDSVLYNTTHSFALYEMLRERDRERPYDVVHFVESLGHGLYSLMAKRQGLAFERATMVIGTHSPRRWLAEAHGVPFDDPVELGDEFLERRSIELADVVVSPSAHMLDWLTARGVRLPERSYVQQYVTCFDLDEERGVGINNTGDDRSNGTVRELVFFGRLEPRKGLIVFCDALDLLAEADHPSLQQATFVGKQVSFGEQLSGDYVRDRAEAWPWECVVIDDLDRDAALDYLRVPERLAVMPSSMDNSPNTVYEAIGLGIPFLASRGGGTAALVHPDDYERVTYNPNDLDEREVDPGDPSTSRPRHTGRMLAPRLTRALTETPRPARFAVDQKANREAHLSWHRAMVGHAPEIVRHDPKLPPQVAVEDLSTAVDDWSELLLVDTDLEQSPELAHTLARALATHPDASFVTALGAFEVQTPSGPVERVFLPSGGPPSCGLMGNCFGAGVVLARRDALQRIGVLSSNAGGPVSKVSDVLARAALAGESIEIVPEALYRLPSTAVPGGSLAGAADSLETISPYYGSLPSDARDIAGLARRLWCDEATARARAESAERVAAEASARLAIVTSSRSWRLTGHLRRAAAAMKGTDRHVLFVLAVCVVLALALRALAMAGWWPISTGPGDSGAYAYFASGVNPLTNPQHPPGYSMFLALIGTVTREIAAFAIIQHLLSIVAALVLFVAVRRLCGSPWPALAGASVILLGADQIYLEHTIMSESFFVLAVTVALYGVTRMLDAPDRWWPWPVVAAVLVVAAGLTRSAGLFLIPIVALGLLLARPRPWLPRWRPVAAFVGTASVLLLAFATANEISNGRFEVAPTGGWHLYGRVAPFADCGQFDPPAGTEGLCERTDPAERLGTDHYLYDPDVPAKRIFGDRPFDHDDQLGAFARKAVLHQPKTYALAIWNDVSAYFVPGSFDWAPGRGSDLDGQLDWTGPVYPKVEREIEEGLENYFFDDFSVSRDAGILGFLHDYQRVFRFGATALTLATLLILAGLFVGPRRNRIAVLVLGGGGLAMFLVPTLSIIYIARYTVPSAGLIAAGAAVAAMSLIRAPWKRLSQS